MVFNKESTLKALRICIDTGGCADCPYCNPESDKVCAETLYDDILCLVEGNESKEVIADTSNNAEVERLNKLVKSKEEQATRLYWQKLELERIIKDLVTGKVEERIDKWLEGDCK